VSRAAQEPHQGQSALEGGVALPHPQAVFGFTKVRYRGLKKNHEWLLAAFALVNLYQNRKRLVSLGA